MKYQEFNVNKENFRSYDIRGEYGNDIDESTAYAVAIAFSQFTKSKKVIIGYDHRLSTPKLKQGLIQGFIDAGVDVIDIGQVSTDTTYFASWFYSSHNNSDMGVEGAIMITASHMPGKYNGMKFITKELKPIGKGSGMDELYELANNINEFTPVKQSKLGKLSELVVIPEYKKWLYSFIDKNSIKEFSVIMDCGNGVAGPLVRELFSDLSLNTQELFFEPDASFPNHEANPIIPENRKDIEQMVKEQKADLGIAWDADADRCYFIDEKGQFIHGDFITALLAKTFLQKESNQTIVYDLRASNVVVDTVNSLGGKAVMQKVGHAHIKQKMRQENAVFGGEVSGHYYFKENHFMDNGFIPAFLMLQLLSQEQKTLSELILDLGEYFVSGEINSTVQDRKKIIQKVKETYSDAKIHMLDGVSLEYEDWRCNLRPSANDPVIRLNLEAKTKSLMEQKTKELLELIRS
jgi:phosphomannomutase